MDNTEVYVVPPGHYFMMGDNRDNSTTAACSAGRLCARENLVGRAEIIFFSIGDGEAAWHIWSWPWSGGNPAVHDCQMSRRSVSGRRELEQKTGYAFADKALLDGALTHISALSGKNRVASYQRLEFLGDHVLGLIVAELLFRGFPNADEGELSRRLADLVRKETCADVARSIDLGASIKLGASEANAGGRQRIAILADVCEALIGAVFLDGGYRSRRGRGRAVVGRAPSHAGEPGCAIPRPRCRNGPRRAACRRRPTARSPAPARTTIRTSASPCCCRNRCRRQGLGRSKRAAEQAAAAALLSREGVEAST